MVWYYLPALGAAWKAYDALEPATHLYFRSDEGAKRYLKKKYGSPDRGSIPRNSREDEEVRAIARLMAHDDFGEDATGDIRKAVEAAADRYMKAEQEYQAGLARLAETADWKEVKRLLAKDVLVMSGALALSLGLKKGFGGRRNVKAGTGRARAAGRGRSRQATSATHGTSRGMSAPRRRNGGR